MTGKLLGEKGACYSFNIDTYLSLNQALIKFFYNNLSSAGLGPAKVWDPPGGKLTTCCLLRPPQQVGPQR